MTVSQTPADHLARQRVREDLDATLVVEAAAGTGKTTVLVGRIVAVVRSGRTRLEKVIAVTFTEKAAGEMKLRLREALEETRLSPELTADERVRLEGALAELEVTRIGTIHALCSELLRERPVEAGVDPLFELAGPEEATSLEDRAFDMWFQSALRDPGEGLRRFLRRKPRPDATARDRLRDAAGKLINHRDFDGAWRRDAWHRNEQIDAVIAELQTIALLADKADDPDADYLAKNLKSVQRFVQEVLHRETVSPRDHDGLEAALVELCRERSWKYTGRGAYGQGLKRAEVLKQRDAVRTALEDFRRHSEADLAALLREELWPVVSLYDEHKARTGKLDFFDLLFKLRHLLREDAAVRHELQERFTHIFVDEFQDTDPLQAEILLLLASGDPAESDANRVKATPGKLFIVGDPKQSIYRFRRADVSLYESIKKRLVSQGASVEHLTTSFRSAPQIQDAVNAAFALRMGNGEGSQAAYVPLHPYRAQPQKHPTLIALPVPRPYFPDWNKVSTGAIELSAPDAVAAFVDFLVHQSGWEIEDPDRDGELVKIAPRHICLLFKRFNKWGHDVTRPYAAGLESRGIPHVLVGGRSFHQREEVLALRNALLAIEWPDDELSVFATLRGPLFAIGDDALFAYKHQHKRLHPLRLPEDRAAHAPVVEALDVIRRLHNGRNRRPLADTVAQLLDATRAHAGFALWKGGDQVLANVLHVLALARRFEAMGPTSFRAFVDRISEEADRGEVGEAPIVEEGSDGVRIMTVHKAKGLEFPVVILADPTAPLSFDMPTRHVEAERRQWFEALAGCVPVELQENAGQALRRDEEEAVRLAYVAATRARDILVVPALGEGAFADGDGWVELLRPVLHPAPSQARAPRAAPGCPAFKTESVLDRPERAQIPFGECVSPGLHKPQLGAHDVVWWDPASLELGVAANIDEKRWDAIEDGPGSADNAVLHEQWKRRRERLIARGTAPGQRVIRVGRVQAPSGGAAIAVEKTGAKRDGRPGGRRFGVLVHAVLADVAFDAGAPQIARLAKHHARMIGATDDEVSACGDAVEAALHHPLIVRARSAPLCRRESPVILPLDDGSVAEGVLDLAFREDGHWVVVDFKTDAEMAELKSAYETQVGLYVRAVATSTGEAASGVVLMV